MCQMCVLLITKIIIFLNNKSISVNKHVVFDEEDKFTIDDDYQLPSIGVGKGGQGAMVPQ